MDRLFAIDLDGTLYYPKHRVAVLSKKTVELIQKIIDAGDKFAVVSGRNLEGCLKVFDKIKRLPYIIGCNGAFVYAEDKVIFDDYIETKVIKEIVDYIKQKYSPKGFYVMSSKNRFILEKNYDSAFYRFCLKWYDFFQGKLLNEYVISKELFEETINNNETYKMMVIFGVTKKAKMIAKEVNKDIMQKYGDIVDTCWTNQTIEISPKSCNKSNGIKILANHLNIDKDNIIVMGDSGNDIPMFKEFYENSFCVKHSNKSVKKYAKHHVKTFNQLGNLFVRKNKEKSVEKIEK